MSFHNILITGGAGFVGSNLACMLKERFPERNVTAFDNLKRRGSEINATRLNEDGVKFVHGDIRCREDFCDLPDFDLLIDCSAEPSVHAGLQGSPLQVVEINLSGTVNCLEAARQRNARFLFFSTSRVFPIARLNALEFEELDTRFRWCSSQSAIGFSDHGISEDFSITGARSFYGASKLACELLITEYAASYGLQALVNRCGVLAGPWQMGKVDQGFVSLWVANHLLQKPLAYMGFGGVGKQVRDLLHIEDLFDLMLLQLERKEVWDGRAYNVGGGNHVSVSLCELTELCVAATANRVPIANSPKTSSVDLRIYITDSRKVEHEFGWEPKRSAETIVRDVYAWMMANQSQLQAIFN
jgi:CDP-paratose 2-epimerase